MNTFLETSGDVAGAGRRVASATKSNPTTVAERKSLMATRLAALLHPVQGHVGPFTLVSPPEDNDAAPVKRHNELASSASMMNLTSTLKSKEPLVLSSYELMVTKYVDFFKMMIFIIFYVLSISIICTRNLKVLS